MATTQSQKCFIKFIRERIVAAYSYTCNLVICRICDGRWFISLVYSKHIQLELSKYINVHMNNVNTSILTTINQI